MVSSVSQGKAERHSCGSMKLGTVCPLDTMFSERLQEDSDVSDREPRQEKDCSMTVTFTTKKWHAEHFSRYAFDGGTGHLG